jgi:hypothetical protein
MADPFGGTAATANNGSNVIWPHWNYYYINGQGLNGTNMVTAVPTTADVIWVRWQMGLINAPAYVQPPETEAERLAREERMVQTAAEQKERERRKAVAKVRARNTLLAILSKQQREEFEKDGHFLLTVNDRLYRIRPGCRVERLDPVSKKIQSFFCIHPAHTTDVPHEDWAISQKLLLEADEPAFLKLANETRAAA